MIPTSHFLSVIQAERAEQMRRSHWLVAARSAREPQPSAVARMIAALRARRAHAVTPTDRPSPAASRAAACC